MTFNKRGLSLTIHSYIDASVLRQPIPREGLFKVDQSINARDTVLPAGVDNVMVSIKQQRPYTDVYVAIEYLGKSHAGAGYSKVCGITDDHPPDEWNPETGIKYALGRAVSDALDLCEATALEEEERFAFATDEKGTKMVGPLGVAVWNRSLLQHEMRCLRGGGDPVDCAPNGLTEWWAMDVLERPLEKPLYID